MQRFYGLGRIQNPHIKLKDFESKPKKQYYQKGCRNIQGAYRVLRSFDIPEGVIEFCYGMRTYYNFIREHQGTDGLIPAQMAGVPIDLMGNRWQKMIELLVK